MQLELVSLSQGLLTMGKATHVDLFNAQGQLLLAKGKIVTPQIMELLYKRELYQLQYEWKEEFPKRRSFSSKLYVKILGSMQRIYCDAHLVSAESLNNTLEIVDDIINELKGLGSNIDFNSLRTFDNYTYVHSINVALLSTIIGLRMGYDGEYLRDLCTGALLHDIGKLSTPISILNKPSGLSQKEFEIIKKHPIQGQKMLQNIKVPSSLLCAVRQHHERWNGHGYPDRLLERAIHPSAQIVGVADVFDALIADRPYRKGLPPYHALEMIIAGSGTDFAPDVVQVFKASLSLYPENSVVTLNTGEVGTVVSVPDDNPTRPTVRVLFDRSGAYVNNHIVIDLLQDLTRFIVKVNFNAAR